MKNVLKIILTSLCLLTACSSKSKEIEFSVEKVEISTDWISFQENLEEEGIYSRKYNDSFYIVFYGKEKSYSNISIEHENEELIITYDSIVSTGGCYQVFEVAMDDEKIEMIRVFENGEETHFETVFAGI